MKTLYCPSCGLPLVEGAKHGTPCARCGVPLAGKPLTNETTAKALDRAWLMPDSDATEAAAERDVTDQGQAHGAEGSPVALDPTRRALLVNDLVGFLVHADDAQLTTLHLFGAGMTHSPAMTEILEQCRQDLITVMNEEIQAKARAKALLNPGDTGGHGPLHSGIIAGLN